MTRTLSLVALPLLVVGCMRPLTPNQGPFARQKKEPPPPYGSVQPGSTPNKPVANHSPLGIPSADSPPSKPAVEPSLIPSEARGAAPPGEKDEPNAFPPRKKAKSEPQLPSPLAPKEPPAPSPAAPAAPAAADAAKTLAPVKELLSTAESAWKGIDTFEATLTRREINPKGQINSEVVLFQYRREPMAVYTRNVGGGGKGREVVYNPRQHGDKMHVKLGEGDHKLMKAGFVAPPISPDDPKVTEKARYSIRDAGFGRMIKALGAAAAKAESGAAPADSLTLQADEKRGEYPHPLACVTHKLKPGDDPLMSAGGTRQYFFDTRKDSPSYGLPVLVIATDAKGKEAEYYLFEKFVPVKLTDADFDPARLKK